MPKTASRTTLNTRTVAAVLILCLIIGGLVAALKAGFDPTSWWQLLLAALVIGPLLLIASALAEGLFQTVCFLIGFIALPICTLGRARTESANEYNSYPWYGVTRGADGKLVFSGEAVGVVGMLVVLVGFIIGAIVVATRGEA